MEVDTVHDPNLDKIWRRIDSDGLFTAPRLPSMKVNRLVHAQIGSCCNASNCRSQFSPGKDIQFGPKKFMTDQFGSTLRLPYVDESPVKDQNMPFGTKKFQMKTEVEDLEEMMETDSSDEQVNRDQSLSQSSRKSNKSNFDSILQSSYVAESPLKAHNTISRLECKLQIEVKLKVISESKQDNSGEQQLDRNKSQTQSGSFNQQMIEFGPISRDICVNKSSIKDQNTSIRKKRRLQTETEVEDHEEKMEIDSSDRDDSLSQSSPLKSHGSNFGSVLRYSYVNESTLKVHNTISRMGRKLQREVESKVIYERMEVHSDEQQLNWNKSQTQSESFDQQMVKFGSILTNSYVNKSLVGRENSIPQRHKVVGYRSRADVKTLNKLATMKAVSTRRNTSNTETENMVDDVIMTSISNSLEKDANNNARDVMTTMRNPKRNISEIYWWETEL